MAKTAPPGRRTLNYRFSEDHKEYIRKCRSNTYNILEGAVRSGKTVDNVFAFAHEIKTAPDRIHLATGSTVANAKLNIGDCNGFGLEWIFRGQCRWTKYKDNEALVIRGPATGNRERIVIFAGGAKADSFKKIRGNSYGLWIATEINLHHDNTIRECFNRQLAARRRKVFWDLNPDNPNAPIYEKYIDLYAVKSAKGELPGGYNYRHFTIFDNVTISEARREEIIAQYDKESVWYLRDILGQRVKPEGLVYPMFNRSRHVVKERPEKPEPGHRYYVSVDYGTNHPLAAGLYDFDPKERRAVMIRELYHNGGSSDRVDNEAYYEMLKRLIGKFPIEYIVIDPSAASLIETIAKYGDWLCVRADNDVVNGIQDVTKFLNAGILFFHESCEQTFREFSAYLWDEKADRDKVVKEYDHSMDQIRYFCRTVLRMELV